MKIVEEEFWTKMPLPAMFIITTNGILGDEDELVMGIGIAREATWKIKNLPKICGEAILKTKTEIKENAGKFLYYFLPVMENEGKNFLGLFQVKLDWKSNATLDIVEKSCKKLLDYMNKNPHISYRMVYPAIGAGRLKISEVHPILEKYFLDKKITFCMRSNSYMDYLNYITIRNKEQDVYYNYEYKVENGSENSGRYQLTEEDEYEMGIDSSFNALERFNYEWQQTIDKINGGM